MIVMIGWILICNKTLVETAEAQDADVVGCGFWEHSIAGITERTFLHRNDSREVILSPFFFGGIYGALWNKLIKKTSLILLRRICGKVSRCGRIVVC